MAGSVELDKEKVVRNLRQIVRVIQVGFQIFQFTNMILRR